MQEIMNPAAFMMIVLGALLLLAGRGLVRKKIRAVGIVISLLGLGAIAFPFLVSLYIAAAAP